MGTLATSCTEWGADGFDSKEHTCQQACKMEPREDANSGAAKKQEPQKRRRGRPRKHPDEVKIPQKKDRRVTRGRVNPESACELTDDIGDEEEVYQVPEEDPNDPEFEPTRRTSHRRRKSIRTYNQRALFEEKLVKNRDSLENNGRGRARGRGRGRGRGRPRGSGRKREDLVLTDSAVGNHGHDGKTPLTSGEGEFRHIVQEVSLYEEHLPTLPPTIPDPVQRLYVVRVDGLDALLNAGAGFRLMTSCVTDDMMVSLFHLTTDKYFVNNNVEDVLQLAQVLRHVWNMLPLSKRLAWENAARKLALEKNVSNEVTTVKKEENDISVHSETMPLREFPFGMDVRESLSPSGDVSIKTHLLESSKKLRSVRSSCCTIQETWQSFVDVQSHLLAGHYTAIFYGCHFCGVLYNTMEALLGHSDCTRWERMLLGETVKDRGKRLCKVEMKRAYLFMVCTDCGLWLPIRMNFLHDRLPKAWNFFATVMEYHSCKKVVPLLVYMAEAMDLPSRDSRLLIQLIPSFIKNFPFTCEECKISSFPTPDEMDMHFQKVHHIKYKCTKCGECSGTELYHKAHLTSHLSESLLLADYLRTTCTFHPPPHCDGPPVIGAEKRLPASGGSPAMNNPTLLSHDLLDDFEPHAEIKLLNSIEIGRMANVLSKEETGSNGNKLRMDLAYEHYDYRTLEESEEEKKAKKQINDYFHALNGTSGPDDEVLDWRTRVNDYSNLVKLLQTSVRKTVSIDYASSSETVEVDMFAAMLAAKFRKRISLPLSACLELLSGNLLLKRYVYCCSCNTILSSPVSLQAHNLKCGGVNGTKLVSLYCPPAPRNGEIECPSCSLMLCSISAFRGHMAIQHGIYVEHKAKNHLGVASEINGSLQDISSRPTDKRSHVARDTDNALWLRFGTLLPKSHFNIKSKAFKLAYMDQSNGFPIVSCQNAPRITHRSGTQVRRRALPSLENVATKSQTVNSEDQHTSLPLSSRGNNQHCVKPFVLVNNMLRCKFCAHQTTAPQFMRDHLQSNHVLVCRACGDGFAHREALTLHGKMGRCSMLFKDISVKHISADCGICKKRMSLANAYLHLFREHLSSVVYDTATLQVYPEHQNLHISRGLGDYENVIKEVIPNSQSTEPTKDLNPREVVVYKKPRNVLCSCYLCGMEMISFEQLTRHLNRHTERWTRCPFCIDYIPIPTHEAMKAHLAHKHMEKRDGSLMCGFCHRMLDRGAFAHLLYMCTQTRKCALCSGQQKMKNAAEMTSHWTNKHLDILRRFQCSDCSMTFCNVEDFWPHQCRSHFMQQRCSCGFDMIFSSRTAFLLHFGMHMDEANMICKLCKFKFSSRIALQNHRLSHAIMVSSSNERQLIVLDTSLLVPEPVHIDSVKRSKKCMKELDALVEEKQINLDVTFVLRNIVRSICQSFGEACDEVTGSPFRRHQLCFTGDFEIIELDDTPGVDDDLVGSGEITPAALSAEVRVEAADSASYPSSNMPGYVEDDDDEQTVKRVVEGMQGASTGTVTVKKVNDDQADDELRVVAEVEYTGGSSSLHMVASREKKYKCRKCSNTFITSVALKLHTSTAHNTDAGGICEKVFGVPRKGFFFICRNCCAVFENQQQFKSHRVSHGPSGSISCGECSAIAYNTPLYEHHRKAHATPDRLFYGCSQCSIMFRTDSRLMFHLREAHGVPLFFFCKACHLGGPHERTIYAHVAVKSHRCRQFAEQKNWSHTATIGVCPMNVLHYQPKNHVSHDLMLQRGSIDVVVPSECSHRSFLAPTDSLITCRDCFCTMTASSFTAAEACRNAGVQKELSMTLDNGTEFPFTAIYDQIPGEGSSVTPSRAIAPRPISMDVPSCVDGLTNSVRNTSDTSGSSTSWLPVRSHQHSSSNSQQVAAVSSPSNGRGTVPLKRRTPAINSDVITLSDDEPGPSTAKRLPMQVSNAVVRNKTLSDSGLRCKICRTLMPTPQIQSLHELHTNGMKWFCLDCATPHMDEIEAVKHYFSVHVKVAEQKALAKGMLFRPIHYQLQCPFPKCRLPLSTLTNLRLHLNNRHRAETTSSSTTCMFRFCTSFARAKHDGQHASYESMNGVEGSCCPLCGTLNQYNIEIPGTPYTMTHIAVHGVRRYHMCRDCFVCFKGDYDCTRMKAHFETTHCTPVPKTSRELLCTLCIQLVIKSQLTEHVIEKHLVTGFKSRDPRNEGKLIVKTGTATRRFLGFDRVHYVDDDSDMD